MAFGLNIGKISLDKLKLQNIYNAYFSMSPREQTIALVAAGVILVLIIVLPITAASSKISKLESELREGKGREKEIIHAIDSYNKKRAELGEYTRQISSGFDSALPSTIESIAETGGVKDKIDNVKPKPDLPGEIFEESSVDVKLKKMNLEQLVNFLYSIENNPDKFLRIKQITIKSRFDNKQELDAMFTVSTYKLIEGVLDEGAVPGEGKKKR